MYYEIKAGTTNFDNSGADLTDDNLDYDTDVNDVVYDEDTNTVAASAESWNIYGAKEISIEGYDVNVDITDYVDVAVDLSASTEDVSVSIDNAKRGTVETGSGDDIIDISVYSNGYLWTHDFTVDSGAGDDFITFSTSENSAGASVYIDGGEGDDFISIAGLEAGGDAERIIYGGEGDDTIIGSASTDYLYGGKGADTIDAGDGDDYVSGGSGDDIISGGDGDDLLYGDHGDDIIDAGNGNDNIDGGEGDDIIIAGDGYDQVDFDADDSYVDGGSDFDCLVVEGTADVTDTINFEAVVANNNYETVEELTVTLTDGLVVMLGGDEGDTIYFTTSTDELLSSEDLTFSEADDSLEIDDDTLALLEEQGYTEEYIESLQAYVASTGETVWTDVDLDSIYA